MNQPPILSAISDKVVNEAETLGFSVIATDPDLPSNTLTFLAENLPGGASLDAETGEFSWTPGETEGGDVHNVTFSVSDGEGGTDSETITITVVETNETPTANNQNVEIDEDTATSITLTGTDGDIPGQNLTFEVLSQPTSGSLSGTVPNLIYTPNANFNGNDSFTFRVNDGQADSEPATVSIVVNAVNDAPIATVPGAQSVNQGQNLFLALGAQDIDAEGGELKVTLGVLHGKLAVASTANLTFITGVGSQDASMEFTGTLADINSAIGNLLYKHTPGYSVGDTLTYTLNDQGNTGSGGALSNTRTVAIDIVPVGPSIFGPDGYIVTSGFEFTGDLNSLLISDDDRLTVFNDDASLVAQIEFYATSPVRDPAQLRFKIEQSVARPGLAVFIQMKNFATGQWDVNVGDIAPTVDSIFEVIIVGGVQDHVHAASGETRTLVTWNPINDEDPSQDGWLHLVDLVQWRAFP